MKPLPISRKPEELLPLIAGWNHIWMSLAEWYQIYELDGEGYSWDAFTECNIIDDPSAENTYHHWRRSYLGDGKAPEEDLWICDICAMEIHRQDDYFQWDEHDGRNMPLCEGYGKPAPEPRRELTGQQPLLAIGETR